MCREMQHSEAHQALHRYRQDESEVAACRLGMAWGWHGKHGNGAGVGGLFGLLGDVFFFVSRVIFFGRS